MPPTAFVVLHEVAMGMHRGFYAPVGEIIGGWLSLFWFIFALLQNDFHRVERQTFEDVAFDIHLEISGGLRS